MGGWEPGDPQRDASRWRQVHLLCREWPGQGQQHRNSVGYRQVPANEHCSIHIRLHDISRTEGVALTDVSIDLQSFVSLPIPTNTWPPNVYCCWIMAFWAQHRAEYTDYWWIFSHLLRAKARGDCFRWYVMGRRSRFPSVKNDFSCKWVEIIWLYSKTHLWVLDMKCQLSNIWSFYS